MAKTPISLIIDDGSPVNLYYFHDLMREHELIVPIEHVQRFASICEKHGVRGKFSVVPMPAGLGRLDKGLSHCPLEHVKKFNETVRKRIAPMFSLTPEIISHYFAFDVKTERFLGMQEDIYFSTLSAEQIADYVSYAINILCNVDLIPDGVTSPWMTGIDNEQNYAEGIGIGFFPSSGLGNGKGLVRIENAFFAVQGTVTHHQVPAGTVQPDQLLVGGAVHLLRRPSAHLPFQGVQLVSAVVVIGGSRAQREQHCKHRHQKTSHNAKILKNLQFREIICPFPPFGVVLFKDRFAIFVEI